MIIYSYSHYHAKVGGREKGGKREGQGEEMRNDCGLSLP